MADPMADPASLQNLQDIIEPGAVGFWPPAPGFWLLLALALIWGSAGAVLIWLRWRQNAYRRVGLQELQTIHNNRQNDKPLHAIQELATLLKRVALSAFPREQVAALSGEDWLDFLDATMDGGSFFSDQGKLLVESLYQPVGFAEKASERQLEELFSLSAAWIKGHKVLGSTLQTGGA